MYILLSTSLLCASLVLFSRNMVYSLVFMVLCFCLNAIALILIRADFIGYVILIVYVGAIAILFLFVLLTLDIHREEQVASLVKNTKGYASHAVALAFSAFLLGCVYTILTPLDNLLVKFDPIFNIWSEMHLLCNINSIAFSLYTSNFPYLFTCGLLLLVAMIGAVLISPGISRKTQSSAVQSYRLPKKAVSITKKAP